MLVHLVDVETDVLAFLYRSDNIQDEVALDQLEHIDDDLDEMNVQFVKCCDRGIERTFGLGTIPAVVHFRHGVPLTFDGEYEEEEEVLEWVRDNKAKTGVLTPVSAPVLDTLVLSHDSLVAIFHSDDAQLPEDLSGVDEVCEANSITLVGVRDEGKAMQLGLGATKAAVVYFERRVPSLYGGNLTDVDAIARWISEQKKTRALPTVTDSLLDNVVEDFEYVAAFFAASCRKTDEKCQEAGETAMSCLDEVADDIGELGVVLVLGTQKVTAVRKCNVTSFPALVLFRNGHPLKYPGAIEEGGAVQLLNWISDMPTLEIEGQIEKVNKNLLEYVVATEDAVLVFFCDGGDKNVDEMISELETVDDNLESEAVELLWCADREAIDRYGLKVWPSLVFFDRGVPVTFGGNLRNDDTILGWITKELQDEDIVHVGASVLDSLLDRLEFVAVIYFEKRDGDDVKLQGSVAAAAREAAEEAKMHDINFVLVSDSTLLSRLGVDDLPSLVYYENNIPFLYPGRLDDKDQMLKWLIKQRNTASIEEVKDAMLAEIVEENEFVAVLFLGLCAEDEDEDDEEDSACSRVVSNLEKIDSGLDEFGIVLVKTHDLGIAHELWLSKFPSLVFYRNGEYVRYPGRVDNSLAVFKWLTSEKTLNIPGKILTVNGLMLGKMVRRFKNMFVFFHEENDIFAERILGELEELEDQLANLGIDFLEVTRVRIAC